MQVPVHYVGDNKKVEKSVKEIEYEKAWGNIISKSEIKNKK